MEHGIWDGIAITSLKKKKEWRVCGGKDLEDIKNIVTFYLSLHATDTSDSPWCEELINIG